MTIFDRLTRIGSMLLMLVLVLPSAARAALLDNGDGTVTDTVTGLMWDKCPHGQSDLSCATGAATPMTWADALAAAASAHTNRYKGHAGWRLPNKNELDSLVELGRATAPAINVVAFPTTPGQSFWTATTYTIANGYSSAWHVNFNDGDIGITDKSTGSHYVRLVRNSQ
jgi:Protein of unknown function (DUF1566)